MANECSQGDRQVSFFMRKGADCLSKWVGESERQLRLLFEQVIYVLIFFFLLHYIGRNLCESTYDSKILNYCLLTECLIKHIIDSLLYLILGNLMIHK